MKLNKLLNHLADGTRVVLLNSRTHDEIARYDGFNSIPSEYKDYIVDKAWTTIANPNMEAWLVVETKGGDHTSDVKLTNDFLASIIDNLEDWLTYKGIIISNDERDEQDPYSGANIWGDDFDDIMTMLRDTCANYGIVVEDRWEH